MWCVCVRERVGVRVRVRERQRQDMCVVCEGMSLLPPPLTFASPQRTIGVFSFGFECVSPHRKVVGSL